MKIGLIGCGAWGRYILRDLKTLKCSVEVVARSEQSIANAKEGQADQVVGSIQELKEPQGIIVATTIDSHYQVIKECLISFPTAPIFCEKPVTNNPIQAKELLTKYPKQIFVMEKWRYHQGILKLKELCTSNIYGELRGIKTLRLSMANPHRDADAVWVLLPHDLSIIMELLGEIPKAQYARGQKYNNCFESLSCFLGENPWVQIEVSARSSRSERRIELFFDQHICVLNGGYATNIQVYEWNPESQVVNKTPKVYEFPEEMPLYSELEAFIKYLNGGPSPKSSLTDATLNVQRISELMALA